MRVQPVAWRGSRAYRRRSQSRARWAPLAALIGGLLLAGCAPNAAPGPSPASAPAAAPPPGAGTGASAASAQPSPAPARLPLRAAYAARAFGHTPVWLAQEGGFFREQGLDVELVFLAGTLTDQGVITGDTPIGHGANVIPTRLAGADLVAIAGVTTRPTWTLFTRAGISSPQELRGKTIISTRPGDSSDNATVLALRFLGLEPHRDVNVQPSGGTREKLTIMLQGLGDAALLGLPDDMKALESGLTPLLNLSEQPIPFMQTAIGTMRPYAREHGEEIRRFLRGYVAAVAKARSDPEGTKAMAGKFLETDDPALLDYAYGYYRNVWGRPDFRVPPESVQSILNVLDVPGAATANPNDFIDNRFVDELHTSGYVRQVGAAD
jgi:NitT/TauT family transport system substrate-binding protein